MRGAGMLCAALLCLALWPIIMHAADDIGVQYPRPVPQYNPDWKSLSSRPHPKVKRASHALACKQRTALVFVVISKFQAP
jgi:hypothetical protein